MKIISLLYLSFLLTAILSCSTDDDCSKNEISIIDGFSLSYIHEWELIIQLDDGLGYRKKDFEIVDGKYELTNITFSSRVIESLSLIEPLEDGEILFSVSLYKSNYAEPFKRELYSINSLQDDELKQERQVNLLNNYSPYYKEIKKYNDSSDYYVYNGLVMNYENLMFVSFGAVLPESKIDHYEKKFIKIIESIIKTDNTPIVLNRQ